jgi:hypothetical protein
VAIREEVDVAGTGFEIQFRVCGIFFCGGREKANPHDSEEVFRIHVKSHARAIIRRDFFSVRDLGFFLVH